MGVTEMIRKTLRHYQRDGVRFQLETPHPALFWEMRLGKSLTVIRRIKLHPNLFFILVIGPCCVIPGWMEELENEGETAVWIDGTKKKRTRTLERIVSGEAVPERIKRLWVVTNKEIHLSVPQIAAVPWCGVVLDESRFIANPQTKIAKYYLKNFRDAKFRACLTGTPAPESDLEYFNQVSFLNPALWEEKTYWEFRLKHFTPDRFGHSWKIKEESKPYLNHVLKQCAFFLKRKQVKMGGVKVYERVAVTLGAEARKIYRTVEEEFLLEVRGEVYAKSIWATQRYLWLRLLCDGFVDDYFAFNHKITELKELLNNQLRKEQRVIWTRFNREQEELQNRLGTCSAIVNGELSAKKREAIRRDFQAGKIQDLIAQPKCFEYGTDLSAAGALIYFSSPESSLTRSQSEDRAVDVSTNDNSLIIDMYCFDTIEEELLMGLLKKETRSELWFRIQNRMKRGSHVEA